jgi:hypothetical protein
MREGRRGTLVSMQKRKMPRDMNQLGAMIVAMASGEVAPEPTRNAVAVESGRRGGLIGGKARAAKLTAEERSESARKAAQARWGKAGSSGR